MMTKAEMEEAIRNLDRRLVNVEQILPTLATKGDLAELKRHGSVQFEALRDDIRMVAEAVAAIPARFDQVDARIDRLSRDTDKRFARTDARLDLMDERFDRLEALAQTTAKDLEKTAKGLETLTERLTDRGVI
jgi:hypothetical protein